MGDFGGYYLVDVTLPVKSFLADVTFPALYFLWVTPQDGDYLAGDCGWYFLWTLHFGGIFFQKTLAKTSYQISAVTSLTPARNNARPLAGSKEAHILLSTVLLL